MTEEEIFKMKEALANHVVKATQHIVMIDPVTKLPSSGGSGCLIIYHDRLFLISVQHVTDKVEKAACIDLGTDKSDGSDLYSLGSMNFIKQFEFSEFNASTPELIELDPLDITYVEINGNIEVFQKEKKFDRYTITEDNKRLLYTELTDTPNKEERYSFFGRIRGKLKGSILEQQEKLILGIHYDRKIGYFERFILPETMIDPFGYKGTSGAPIISETGAVVAFVASGKRGTKYLYGFSAVNLKTFLDIYIQQNPLEKA